MTAGIVADTITKITERMSSLRGFGSKTTTTITNSVILHLSTIKGVVEHSDAAKVTPDWLIDVTDAVSDLWELLEAHHVPADAALLRKQSNITSFFSVSRCTPHWHRLRLQLEQIENRVQYLAGDSTKLALKSCKSLANSDLQDREIEIVGRENAKEEIIRMILARGKVKGAVPVVTIKGMKGMGKTILAKFVCNDKRVKDNFDLVIWIDGIHEELYAESVLKRMINESAIKKKKFEEKDPVVMEENLNLSEGMNGTRFFLVLDDLRNENAEEWRNLKQKLAEAARSSGGAVLITTQNNDLAFQVGGPSTWTLESLTEEDSWTLFQQVVGEDPGESKIRHAQKKMVKKCRGVPIAIVTMARIWRQYEDSEEEFTQEMIENLEEEFMQEMQLLYYEELSFWPMKQCFAYLSFIFSPTNWVNVDTLVWIWMAEGFLGPVNSSSLPQQPPPEDLGFNVIREFFRRSFVFGRMEQFGRSTYSRMDCRMDNIFILELSTFVARKAGFCMENHGENVKETVHRVSLTPSLDVTNGSSKSVIEKSKSLRTILFPMPPIYGRSSRIPFEVTLSWYACDAIFRAFGSLRVLNLSDLGIRMLPISIGELESLRYLNLSHNNMKRLPNSVGKLKRLQTLILSDCHQLSELPNEIKHLVSLRHLEMKECLHLAGMPSALKKLTNLVTLSNFVAKSTCKNHNRKQMGGLGELINLSNLRGELEISHLERLKFKEWEHGGLAYLKGKQYLENLTLKWNHDDDDDDDDTDDHDEISLGHLEPHPNLKFLRIAGYKGRKFSSWLSSLENLISLTLYNCATCKSLPPLDQFPKLNVLKLRRLDSLEYITDQDDDRIELGLELLKVLEISDCPKLTSWWKGRAHNGARFPSLSGLGVKYCPKLDSMPLYPDLDETLLLEGSSVKPLAETISYSSARSSRMPSDLDSISNTSSPLSKLFDLTIQNVEEQSPLPEDWLKNFISLQYLWISGKMSLIKGFKHLSSLHTMIITKCTGVDLPGEGWEGLESLQTLIIDEVVKLKSLPEGIQHLKTLTRLDIRRCPELTSLTEGIGYLTSLAFLLIEDCHKLALLPKGMEGLTSLKELRIRNCPLLLPRCQKETGDDWPQIKHIQDIQLTGISEVYE